MIEALFRSRFKTDPDRTARAPARVNLIGEWVDFNGGMVVPAALPVGVELALRESGDHDVIHAQDFDGDARFALDAPAAGHWSDYVRGALQSARSQGWISGGCEVVIASSMPAGAGLSSSAAVIVATLLAAHGPADEAQRVEIAKLARRVENEFIGVPCGIMDQMAVALAAPGEVIALDTSDLAYERLSIPAGWGFAVVHSGEGRALADGAYADRRNACEAACRALGVADLCGVDPARLARLEDELLPVARHVVEEDRRARAAVDLLRSDAMQAFGETMNASHASLRDDFRVSTPGIDALVSDCLAEGAVGARITGAGFGGCIVALIASSDGEAWWARVSSRHPKARRVSLIGGGAS